MDNCNDERYCPLIKKEISEVDCYEVASSAAGPLKKEALFVKFDIDNWIQICNKCPRNQLNL